MTGTARKKYLDLTKRSPASQKLQDTFAKHIIGQPQAVECFSDIVERYQAGMCDPTKPAGNAIFLGPTGSGKTFTVECAAEALFGDPRRFIKIDCAEFQHSHEIAKLVGSPPGYLGHRETHPMFTQAVLNQYHNAEYKMGIILFDEIEKANDSLWTLLLGVLDKATLTCGDNSTVNFSQQIIVMTSNLGVSELSRIMGEHIGFLPAMDQLSVKKTEDVVLEAMKRKFTPEFLNRIDNTIVFNTLTEDNCKEIMGKELGKALERIFLASHTMFRVTPGAKEAIFAEGFSKEYGARNLKRAIEKRITLPMAKILSSNQVKEGDHVNISVNYEGDSKVPTFEYFVHEENDDTQILSDN